MPPLPFRDANLAIDEAQALGRRVIQQIDGAPHRITGPAAMSLTSSQQHCFQRDPVNTTSTDLNDHEQDFIIPSNPQLPPRTAESWIQWTYFEQDNDGDLVHYIGNYAPGIISLSVLFRRQDIHHSVPHVSNLAILAYQTEYHTLKDLQHIFVENVKNGQTLGIVMDFLFPDWLDGEDPPAMQMRSFAYGTDEYAALLGSRIGRTVAYMVLGGFASGSRRIIRINIYRTDEDYMWMRFDLAPVIQLES